MKQTIDVQGIIDKGIPWVDPTFTKEQALLNVDNASEYTWQSLNELFPESDGYSVFELNSQDSIDVTDITQGSIGNCWTIASIASIAEDTGDIYKLFDTK